MARRRTGPLATSWHISKFLNPVRDGAVLPILHLNGYKINNPTLLARITHEELEDLLRGYGWTPYFVEGSDPDSMHQAMAATVEHCVREIRLHQQECRPSGVAHRPRWPMIVLRSPKGWGAPLEVGGHRVEGFWRAHQVPLTEVKKNPEQLQILEKWMRAQKPEELFDQNGKLIPELKELAPVGQRRMSANPHANGGVLKKLRLPPFSDYAVKVDRPGAIEAEKCPSAGRLPERRHEAEHDQLPCVRARRKHSNQAPRNLPGLARSSGLPNISPKTRRNRVGARCRVVEMLSEHTMEGMLKVTC
jgi:xylulose-5-phosphate/fructose-6-phosphate phosphoketolase